MDSHLEHIDVVLTRLSAVNMRVKAKKFKFARTEVPCLGFIITSDGIKADPEKVEAILRMLPPETVTEVRAFLGMIGYYRKFVPGFAAKAEPLTDLTKKEMTDVRANWTPECAEAFGTLKKALSRCCCALT